MTGIAESSSSHAHRQHGDHTDTIENVDLVFKEQRKLSFTYGAVFFAVTLSLPVLGNYVEAWWGNTVWGGFSLNYLFVSLLYYVFLWTMAWTYAKQADRLDDKLAHLADKSDKS